MRHPSTASSPSWCAGFCRFRSLSPIVCPEPGTIADTVAHLALGRLAPRGISRVEYHTEFSRSETDRRLGETLQDAKIPYHRIALPVRRPPSEVMGRLLAQLEAPEPAVVSITGFVTAVPDDAWREFLGHLTWNRERLAGFNHRQIWWMTPEFVDAFIHTVPDLASWFMVRLTIEEEFIPAIETATCLGNGPTGRPEVSDR